MSVTAAKGFVAGGGASRHQGRTDAPDLAIVATADGQPVVAAAVFTTNLAAAAPGAGQPRPPRGHRRPRRGRRAQLGQRQRRHGSRRPGDVARRVRPRRARRSAATPTTCSCARPASSASRLPLDTFTTGVPAVAATLAGTPEAGEAAAEAIMTTDTHAQGVRGRRQRRDRRRHGKGRSDAQPRTWPRCSRCSPPTPSIDPRGVAAPAGPGHGRVVPSHHRRRLHVDQRHRHHRSPAAKPTAAPTTRPSSANCMTRVCVDLAEQMV